MEHTSSATSLAIGSGLSANVDPVLAAEQICEQASSSVESGQIDLAIVFASGGHAHDLDQVCTTVSRMISPATIIAVTAQSVSGTNIELEQQTGVSLFAASLPGTVIQSFTYRDLPHVEDADDLDALEKTAQALGVGPDLRAVLVVADPFSVPAASMVDSITNTHRVVDGLERCPVIGGMASAATRPGGNMLLINDHAMRHGAVGVTIRGDVNIDTVVSQGCRPIGTPMVITSAQRNIIKSLGGRRAMDVLRDLVTGLDAEDRELLSGGLFVGRVINEYKSHFGRGDFLIRGVVGVEQKSGAVTVGESVRAGQTVQFHVRDAKTADEDLALLVAAQKLQHPPAGGLLFTCNGRGTGLFGEPNHDAEMLCTSLCDDAGQPMPLAGFAAAGEIGPIGPTSFLHGHTCCCALFRAPRRDGGHQDFV